MRHSSFGLTVNVCADPTLLDVAWALAVLLIYGWTGTRRAKRLSLRIRFDSTSAAATMFASRLLCHAPGCGGPHSGFPPVMALQMTLG